jgi:integrase
MGAGWRERGRVFTRPDGAELRPDTLTQAWTRSVKRSTLPRIRLHDLRHTHATHLLVAGRGHREIADRFGHEDAGFTLRTYAHIQPGAQRAGAQAVADLVQSSVTTAVTK